MLGAAKHDRVAMPAEDVAEHAQLQTSVGMDQAMLEERWTFGHDLHPQRILQVLFDHPRDPVRHRRRREDGLRRVGEAEDPLDVEREDRKSTRLNSSHSQISYAVFCLK